jgi:hypothetical protein
MTRIRNSWDIAKASWAVLRSDSQLVWLPVLSVAATLGVVLVAGVVVVGVPAFRDTPMLFAIGAVAYLAIAFVGTYFTGALVAAADEGLRGGSPTVADALRAANARLHRLLPWALVTATVSLVIQQIERYGPLGRIVGALAGLAWNVITFLTVPVLVLEDVGVGTALRRSKDLFVKTWGENLVAQIGLGTVGALATLPAVALMILCALTGVTAIAVLGVVVGVAWLLIASAVIAALSGIYRTALYRYAADGRVPEPFAGTAIAEAFGPRRSRGFFSSN